MSRLGWRALTELVGERTLRKRVETLDTHVDMATLDNETAAQIDLAMKIVRGEAQPDPDWG